MKSFSSALQRIIVQISRNTSSILGAAVPILVAIGKIPVFTRVFSPAQWGEYVLVLSALSFAVMLLFSWQLACIWRFFLQAKKHKTENELWQRLHKAWSLASISLLCIAIVSAYFLEPFRLLILSGTLSIITAQWVGMRLIVLQLNRQHRQWATLTVFNALGSFLLAILLVLLFKLPPYCIFVASAIMQALIAVYLLIKRPIVSDRKSTTSSFTWNQLLRYGMLNVSIELVLTVLTLADRFIIASLCNNAMLGMYGQCFSIAQFAVAGLSAIFLARYNPMMNAALTHSAKYFRQIVPIITVKYCIITLPVVFWISMYASAWSPLLLAKAYQPATVILLPVSLAYFLYGLSLLSENEALFQGNYRRILIIYGIALVISLAATLGGVALWAYKGAAWATLLAYSIIFIWFNPLKYLKTRHIKILAKVFGFLIIQTLIHFYFDIKLTSYVVVEFLLFLILYAYCFVLRKKTQY